MTGCLRQRSKIYEPPMKESCWPGSVCATRNVFVTPPANGWADGAHDSDAEWMLDLRAYARTSGEKIKPNTSRMLNLLTMAQRMSRARVVRAALIFLMGRLNRRLYARDRLLHNNEIEFIDQNAFDSQTKLLLLYLGRSFHFFSCLAPQLTIAARALERPPCDCRVRSQDWLWFSVYVGRKLLSNTLFELRFTSLGKKKDVSKKVPIRVSNTEL